MNKSKPLRNSKALLLVLLLFFSGIQISAADPNSRPLIKPLEPDTEWKITFVPPKESNAPAGRILKEINGSRSKTLRHEILIWSDGQSDRWIVKNFLLETIPGRNEIVPSRFPLNPKFADARLGSLPEFDWISATNHQGIVELKGQRLHHYKETKVVALDPDEASHAQKGSSAKSPENLIFAYEAWINADTLLPFAFEDNGVRREYEFKKTKDIHLELPSAFGDVAKALDPSFVAQ